MKAKLTVEGLNDLVKNLKKADKGLRDALSAAIYQEAMATIGQSVPRVPVDTGRLRATAYASPPQEGARSPTGECGYGTDYALPVHENLLAYHEVGGPKFLESVMNERRAGYRQRMADRTWSNYKRGVGVRAVPSRMRTRPGK